MSKTGRWVTRGIVGLALATAVVGMGSLLTVQLASKFGNMTLGMKTGSMHPTINPGDVVVARAVPAATIRVGDLITARRPIDGAPYTHRVIKVLHVNNSVEFRTKGDANSTADGWTVVYPNDQAWRVVHVLRDGGYLLSAVESRAGRDLTAVSVFILVLAMIWPVIVPKDGAARIGAEGAAS